jgi:L-threonylcarbamoyladenylate synthase
VIDAADARRLQECLAGGGVAVFPADTVYGLCCDPLNERAVRRLYELKGRPAARPAAVMFFALTFLLRALPELRASERAALQVLLPGPVTLLLGNRDRRYPLASGPGGSRPGEGRLEGSGPGESRLGESGPTEGGADSLGLRVPAWTPALAALAAVDVPVLQSSANLSGGPDARRLLDVPESIRSGADLVLDGGELPGVPSTVIDLREYAHHGQWRIVREGALSASAVERALA